MGADEHIFISDVHLGAFSDQKNAQIENELVALIEYAIHKKTRLYVLGDLFDYWMEFPGSQTIPQIGKKALAAFFEYNRTVCPALFITGNHDNWTLGYFEELGFKVEADFCVVEIDTIKTLLLHGDGTFDNNGLFLRGLLHRILRNESFLKIYRWILPPKLGIFMMNAFSSFSKLLERSDPIPLSKNAAWASEHLGVKAVLCGHDHLPRTEHLAHGLYINTGTFFHHKTVGRYVNGEFELVTWKSSTKEFAPFS